MISLRPVLPTDADVLFPLISGTGITDTLHWDGPESLETYKTNLTQRVKQIERGETHYFTIIEDYSDLPIGSANIRPEKTMFRADIGLWLGKPYQGKGYGSEVINDLLEYGFYYLGLQKIEATVFVDDWLSRRIFEKNGFSLEGTKRRAVNKLGKPIDEWLFGIINEEYEKIVHICTQTDWKDAHQSGEYCPRSLRYEGFIHCSRSNQVLEVANVFYQDISNLVLLWINVNKVHPDIRWEDVEGESFPHIYGALNLEAVIAVQAFQPDPDGVYRKMAIP